MFDYNAVLARIPYLLTALGTVNILIALAIIFLERKNPTASLAWIMILFLLPGIGLVLYIFLSQNISRQKMFRLTKYEEDAIDGALASQIKEIGDNEFDFTTVEAKRWKDMIKLNQTYAKAFLTQDNRLFIMTDGAHMFDCLIDDIRNAKRSINIMFFIVKNDYVGRKLIEELTKKAKEGIETRLLIDAMGSRQISSFDLAGFKRAGGKCAFFFPPKIKYLNMKLNYRNHRKIAVIDGELGYIGGFNIGKEYLGQKKRFGYWRDTHLKVLGSGVQDINARFLLDWRFASKENVVLSEAYYSEVISVGISGLQIVSSGPDSQREEIKRCYMKMITSARKTVFIQTPYFVPDASILESLKMAALAGVDVRIMIPCKPDHMFVYWATYSYVGELLNSGVRVFIYENGFLHAKTVVVDGEIASIGSANFDMRSFKLNFEANAVIYDAAEAYKLEAVFESDMLRSRELTRTAYRKRSILIRFKESISRLLSDLL
ncbi:MAG: cardiolipin synthase [Clostridiales bacterium]|nr:cardiolipin synthase [Clostridiales bacterium]